MKTTIVISFVLLAGLGGCSTPTPVMEQANLGVSMIAELEASLKSYRTQQSRSERYLTYALAEEQASISHVRELGLREQLSINAVASPKAGEVQKRLLALTQGLADARGMRVAASDVEATTKRLLSPIPGTTEATTASQAAMAKMSKELPADVRFKEARAQLEAVRASLKDAKKAVKDAEAKAATDLAANPG